MVMTQKMILADLDALKGFDKEGLKALWQDCFGDAPRPLSRDLTIRKIAWYVQEKACGGLPARTRTKLDRLISGRIKATVNKYTLAPRSQIKREWNGRTYIVHITDRNRFEYDGRMYRSLTAIAKEITGAHWSGPLFFGLKKYNDGKA